MVTVIVAVAYCLLHCSVTVLAEDHGGAWWWMGGRKPVPGKWKMRWINPCGFKNKNTYRSIWYDDVYRPTGEQWRLMLQVTQMWIGKARRSFEEFRERYVQETFQVKFFQHHREWAIHDYEWLPKLPKKLGEKTPKEHLKTLFLDRWAGWCTHWLQIVDVALEQVLWDWHLEGDQGNPKYKEAFEDIWYTNNLVLCDTWSYVRDLGLQPMPDIGREVMPYEFRDIQDETTRNIRDWIIFRCYMNLLEYMDDVLNYWLDFGYIGPWFSSLRTGHWKTFKKKS
ncbi:uncharacterized protein LOC128996026 [Macrosteles quadrilineatus]|uniref:uncharacterized protein LOC128996026 n=1 Tax=Macrosteles quadrilineatus TaxID=74068 RepID=UPI0023E3118E|nr:uncharacterized protein LOC128996026 [Macrosteles quadrilineatus]